jgi:GPH family glycoside/pentoside/hexuronide:cation symporter
MSLPMKALPRRKQLFYSTSSIGAEALSQSRNLWLVYFYAPPADSDHKSLLPLGVVGAVMFLGRVLGSLDDIFIGFWSDASHSRLGRRLPFILVGTPLWALFSVLLFMPPQTGERGTAIFLLVMLELLGIFTTVATGPYEALFPEIARTSKDRIDLSSLRVYFGVGGAAIGLVSSGLLIDQFGFAAMAVIMGVVAMICHYIGTAGVWKLAKRDQPAATLTLRESLRVTFSNRSFLHFLPSFTLFQIGLTMLVAVLPYYAKVVLGAEDEGAWVSILTAVAIGMMVIFIPVFARLAHRTTKRHAFSMAMLGAAMTFPLLFFAGFLPWIPKTAQVLIAVALAGAPIAGVYLFPGALTADIADDDETRTGMRREATYYGAQNFVEKTASSLSPLLLSLLLLLGHSSGDSLGIRLVGPVAAVFVFGGFLTFRSYQLPDQVESPALDQSPALEAPG